MPCNIFISSSLINLSYLGNNKVSWLSVAFLVAFGTKLSFSW